MKSARKYVMGSARLGIYPAKLISGNDPGGDWRTWWLGWIGCNFNTENHAFGFTYDAPGCAWLMSSAFSDQEMSSRPV